MRDVSQSLNQIVFTTILAPINHFSLVKLRQAVGKKLLDFLNDYKEELLDTLAVTGMGGVILFSVYFFLIQLAEYGW